MLFGIHVVWTQFQSNGLTFFFACFALHNRSVYGVAGSSSTVVIQLYIVRIFNIARDHLAENSKQKKKKNERKNEFYQIIYDLVVCSVLRYYDERRLLGRAIFFLLRHNFERNSPDPSECRMSIIM